MEEIKLPKRSDSIYKEIEEFEDYEYSNCIAYEMCIRNKEVKRLIKVLNKMEHLRKSLKPYERINWKEKRRDYYPIVENQLIFNIIKKELKDKYFIDVNLKQKINNKLLTLKDDLGLISFYPKPKSIEATEFETKKWEKFISIDKIGINETIKDGYYSIQTYYKKEDKYINKIYSNFKNELSKPKNINNKTQLEINLNLPKKELIAYISKIKDDYDKSNFIVKTPLELLGEDTTKSNSIDKNKINKGLIAKKFFVYDYVSIRLEEIEDSNQDYIIEYEESKKIIENNPYTTRQDKFIQLRELKKELEENTKQRIIEIFEEFDDIPKGTAKRYYYDIKPFIDDLKYKELI